MWERNCVQRILSRNPLIYRLNYQTRERIKETALYRCAHVSFRGHTVPVPCLRRRTEGPPGPGGARGPGSVRAGAFAAEHLAQWALLAALPSPPHPSPLSPSHPRLSGSLLPSLSEVFPFLFLSLSRHHCRSLAPE